MVWIWVLIRYIQDIGQKKFSLIIIKGKCQTFDSRGMLRRQQIDTVSYF
jgi:hypothetical protein